MGEETWETVQQRTFTNWVNAKLEKGEERSKTAKPGIEYNFKRVADLTHDLKDGLTLLALIYAITGTAIPYNKKPLLIVHRRENIEKVINYLKEKKVQMVNIGASDIEEGSAKLTLALVWRLIIFFSLYELREEVGNDRDLKEKILGWCREKTKGYGGVDVANFGGSWRDGLAISALAHSDLGGFTYNDGTPESRATRALNLALTQMKVPMLIRAKDLTDGLCDEKSVLTYLLGFYTVSRNIENETQQEKERQAILTQKGKIEQRKAQKTGALKRLSSSIVSIEAAKNELDRAYVELRASEEEAARNAISYLMEVDLLSRMAQPYAPYAPEPSTEQMPVSGLFDLAALADTLHRWNMPVGEGAFTPYSSALAQCLGLVEALPDIISFTAVSQHLEHLIAVAEHAAVSESSLKGCSLKEREREASARATMRILAEETKEAQRAFAQVFAQDIKTERIVAEACTAEGRSLPDALLPTPSSTDLDTFGCTDVYLQVVSEGMILRREGNAKQFIPIQPEAEK
ncbi:hypothetical protein NEDG_01957 [Nematocida displodere]|uniref:Calponin-homology (CH) domain-containing protein n=1 Tax=Nematocida displodere TaxID=1805483 RepID=A0A177EJ55_9MICR|nr:hypothetical protein NEDG_01957 [Nematocida displodere]